MKGRQKAQSESGRGRGILTVFTDNAGLRITSDTDKQRDADDTLTLWAVHRIAVTIAVRFGYLE